MILASLKKHIYVSIRIKSGWSSVEADLGNGRRLPLRETGRLDLVDCKLCTLAEWLGSEGDRHRVKFVDGQTAWLEAESPMWWSNYEKSA